jgi:UDP-2,4-diacetamido-2,4,6-trideoxy-beta-L-altropyranose hydrolase
MRKKVRPRLGPIHRILVSFGGSDPDNFTSKALQALQGISACVDVVVGESHSQKNEIQTLCESLPGWNYHCQTGEMARLMAEADFFLGAGGNTAWERCCLGLPGLAVSLADNQSVILGLLDSKGTIRNLGHGSEVSILRLRQELQHFSNAPEEVARMSKNAFAMTDGLGAMHAAEVIMKGTICRSQ